MRQKFETYPVWGAIQVTNREWGSPNEELSTGASV